MYTMCLLFALAGLTPSAQGSEAPAWQTDYRQARQQGMTEGKPLVVVVGTGQDGWKKLSRAGTLSQETVELIQKDYIPVYVDAETEQGQRLARQLEVGKLGIVISDRTGKLMAFYHAGDLTDTALNGYLRRYADPQRVVTWTESNPGPEARTSYYAPVFTQPVFNGSYCPNCRR